MLTLLGKGLDQRRLRDDTYNSHSLSYQWTLQRTCLCTVHHVTSACLKNMWGNSVRIATCSFPYKLCALHQPHVHLLSGALQGLSITLWAHHHQALFLFSTSTARWLKKVEVVSSSSHTVQFASTSFLYELKWRGSLCAPFEENNLTRGAIMEGLLWLLQGLGLHLTRH